MKLFWLMTGIVAGIFVCLAMVPKRKRYKVRKKSATVTQIRRNGTNE